MKLNVINTSTGFIPETQADSDLKAKLHIGHTYEVSLKHVRNPKFHRLYFALINCAWQHLDPKWRSFFGENIECFRKTVEVSAGHYEHIYSPSRREWIQVPKSISFESISETDFSSLYERVRQVLFEHFLLHVSMDEFDKELKYF